jgi:hypothetical protein
MNGGNNALPSFASKIRVEVYLPIRYEEAYQTTLNWIIREFTELRGGCTVVENIGGYYLSNSQEIIDDRISIVYSGFPMDWDNPDYRNTDELFYNLLPAMKSSLYMLENT